MESITPKVISFNTALLTVSRTLTLNTLVVVNPTTN